jgi:alpha-1,6-mannosyltransferase
MCWKRYARFTSIRRHKGSSSIGGMEASNLDIAHLKGFRSRHIILLALCGFVQLGVYSAILSLGDSATKIGEFVALFLFCFLLYALSVLISSRLARGPSASLALVVTIFLFSFAFRLIMLPLKPSLSHDTMRFLWDGRLLSHGVNPYLYRPDSPELSGLKNVPYFLDYEFKNTFTIYPPVAQFLFAAAYVVVGDDPIGIKAVMITFDLLNMCLLTVILRGINERSSLSGLVVYAWSPLLIVESAGNGHIEPLPLFFLLLSVYLLSKRRFRLSSITYSLACWSKLFPMLLLPVYLKYLGKSYRGHLKEFILYFVGSSLLLFSPVLLSSGLNFPNQIIWYSQNITYNPSLFLIVKDLLAQVQSTVSVATILNYSIFTLVFVTLLKLKSVDNLPELAENLIWIFGVFLLFSPSVFQWYLIWFLPFLVIRGLNKRTMGWFYFTAVVVLPYLYQFSLDYEPQTIALLEYVPLYAVLLLSTIWTSKPFSRFFQHVRPSD